MTEINHKLINWKKTNLTEILTDRQVNKCFKLKAWISLTMTNTKTTSQHAALNVFEIKLPVLSERVVIITTPITGFIFKELHKNWKYETLVLLRNCSDSIRPFYMGMMVHVVTDKSACVFVRGAMKCFRTLFYILLWHFIIIPINLTPIYSESINHVFVLTSASLNCLIMILRYSLTLTHWVPRHFVHFWYASIYFIRKLVPTLKSTVQLQT